jgi:hypothetical protein
LLTARAQGLLLHLYRIMVFNSVLIIKRPYLCPDHILHLSIIELHKIN